MTPDFFAGDAFSMSTLTDSINRIPKLPTKLGSLGLFKPAGLPTTTCWIEQRDQALRLIQTSPRGAPAEQLLGDKRDALKFSVPHISLESTIYAAEIQDRRQFGSETSTETVESAVNDRMQALRRNIESTWEWHRCGALKGQVLDADGSVLYDLYDEFAATQPEKTIALSDPATKVRTACLDVVRTIEDSLGAASHSGIVAACGEDFFDELIDHADVRDAYARYQDGAALRDDPRAGFQFAGITFVEYRGSVGDTKFLAADDCYAFPTGTDNFIARFGPADFLDSVNNNGVPLFAKIAQDAEFQRYARLHVQSNPLFLNTNPGAVVKIEAT